MNLAGVSVLNAYVKLSPCKIVMLKRVAYSAHLTCSAGEEHQNLYKLSKVTMSTKKGFIDREQELMVVGNPLTKPSC